MDTLDRMFAVLVRNLRAKQPTALTGPISVADLHQQILPYRHYRRELGIETNQEYELALMQLLSGARGYLDVDERLRDGLGKELASLSPEPSRVRDYADAQVSINPQALSKIPEPVGHEADDGGGGLDVRARVDGREYAPPPGMVRASAGSRCRYCGGDLPSTRALNYCPHCGQNLQVLNCPACGAEVEAGWKFCVVCGRAAS
jgi:double zinc ribbon protein